jgi:putative transposase
MIATAVTELASVVGTRPPVPAHRTRATHYRPGQESQARPAGAAPPIAPVPHRGRAHDGPRSPHAERFVDASPAATYATLLDEGTYLASERTMYRILAAAGEVRERR